MYSITRFAIVAGFLAVSGLGLSAIQAAEQKQGAQTKRAADKVQPTDQKQTAQEDQQKNQDRWRYTFHNDEWWYWLPSNRWVYWRNNRWNTYEPETYTLPNIAGDVAAESAQSGDADPSTDDSDVGPFYGRTIGDMDNRNTEADSEIGPFYGNPLPSDIFGKQGVPRGSRPPYGRAASSNGD